MLPAILAGAAIGLAKNQLVDKPRQKREAELAAQTALYSPWTGMKPNEVQHADAFGNALQGATSGAMFAQAGQQAEMNQQMMDMKKAQMSQGMGAQPNLYGGQASAMNWNQSPYSMMS